MERVVLDCVGPGVADVTEVDDVFERAGGEGCDSLHDDYFVDRILHVLNNILVLFCFFLMRIEI